MAAASHRVTLLGVDGARAQFLAEEGRSLARTAARAGYDLTTGCLQGRCAICRGRIVTGVVAAVRQPSKQALTSPVERSDGCVLLCSVGPLTDLVIETLSPWHTRA